jgi:hypothetical protein
MTAAPDRRRVSAGAVAGFLVCLFLVPPIFVLGPLACLLLFSRPATAREVWWLVATGLGVGVSVVPAGGITEQMVLGWGVLASGSFVALMFLRRGSFLQAALPSLGLACAGMVFWGWSLGIGWTDVELGVAHQGWEFCRSLLHAAPAGVATEQLPGYATFVDALASGIGPMARLFPGMLVLMALAGLAVAWTWYHRIAVRPIGLPLAPLAELRFNDHLVWLVVIGLAVGLLPLPDPAQNVAGNLLVVMVGLYAARGSGVVRAFAREVPSGLLVMMALGLVFVLPVALGALAILGVADTWVNFRRRLLPPPLER